MFTTDVGGGVSQLSTTVFNAAWWGGFEIVEHQPHSIWITRYPAGREATFNYGTIDNKFRNNSQHGDPHPHVVHGTSITVSIYGDKEGKVVREENREVTSGTPGRGCAVHGRVRPRHRPTRAAAGARALPLALPTGAAGLSTRENVDLAPVAQAGESKSLLMTRSQVRILPGVL